MDSGAGPEAGAKPDAGTEPDAGAEPEIGTDPEEGAEPAPTCGADSEPETGEETGELEDLAAPKDGFEA